MRASVHRAAVANRHVASDLHGEVLIRPPADPPKVEIPILEPIGG
jgi:hypothetical protein